MKNLWRTLKSFVLWIWDDKPRWPTQEDVDLAEAAFKKNRLLKLSKKKPLPKKRKKAPVKKR